MRLHDAMKALADGDAQVVEVTAFAGNQPVHDNDDTVIDVEEYERQVALG